MSSSTFLRSCICSFLILCLVIDASAQRSGRRRSVSTTVEKIEMEVDTIRELNRPRCGLMAIKNEEKVTGETPACRETKMLNKPDIADSYPFLSEDGLRLYYTSNREGGHGRFFISTRKSVHDPFSEPTVLSKHLTDGYYAGTLTADELTLCMVKSGDMYISVRKNRNEIFPEPIKLTGAEDIYHFGPSISPDGKEIVVTVSPTGTDRTRIYQRNGTYSVTGAKDLAAPSAGEPGPGQLSKDGLQYYLSIETKTNEHLWRYSRASLSDDFSNLEELPEQMKGLKNILQPSLNSDGSVMVFVTAKTDIWSEDDILLVNSNLKKELDLPKLPADILAQVVSSENIPVKLVSPEVMSYSTAIKDFDPMIPAVAKPTVDADIKKPMINPVLIQAKVYPNPFVTSVRIEIDRLPENGAIFNLYDISGKLIRQEKINSRTTSISLEQLIAGTYTFQLINNKGEMLSSGNLVKAGSLKAF